MLGAGVLSVAGNMKTRHVEHIEKTEDVELCAGLEWVSSYIVAYLLITECTSLINFSGLTEIPYLDAKTPVFIIGIVLRLKLILSSY